MWLWTEARGRKFLKLTHTSVFEQAVLPFANRQTYIHQVCHTLYPNREHLTVLCAFNFLRDSAKLATMFWRRWMAVLPTVSLPRQRRIGGQQKFSIHLCLAALCAPWLKVGHAKSSLFCCNSGKGAVVGTARFSCPVSRWIYLAQVSCFDNKPCNSHASRYCHEKSERVTPLTLQIHVLTHRRAKNVSGTFTSRLITFLLLLLLLRAWPPSIPEVFQIIRSQAAGV
jgi:hypothetical protein